MCYSTVSDEADEEHALAVVVRTLRSHAMAHNKRCQSSKPLTPLPLLVQKQNTYKTSFKDLQWYLAILNHKIVQTYPDLDSEMVDKDDRLANDC